MYNKTVMIIAIALVSVSAGTALAQTNAAGPIANGDFESFSAPDEVKEPFQDTPADECIGIGHQADWGEDSPQGALFGDDANDILSDPGNADPSAERVVDRYTDGGGPDADQAQEDAEEQSGYGHCVFSEEEGRDKYWLNPAEAGGTTDEDAALWSVGTAATAGQDFDGNPFDKEIRFESNPDNGGDHNLWQNMFHPGRQYLYTANFTALEFDLEDGAIPADASVKISLGAEPLNVQEPFAAVFIDCTLSFSGTYLQASIQDGTVSASPVDDRVGYDGAGDIDCPPEGDDDGFDWGQASEDERREVLGRLSIVQVSFWNFNDGDVGVTVDNVALPGATLHAEEVADGNFRVCTDVDDGTVDETTCSDDTIGKG